MSVVTQDPGPQSFQPLSIWGVLKQMIYGSGALVLGPIGAQQVINNSGSDILADKLVALVNADSTLGVPQIVLANAGTAGHENVYVTRNTIVNGGMGVVYEAGLSAPNLNTNSFSGIGATVYLNTVAGGFTQTAPSTSTSRVQPVGFVVAKSATVGQIYWNIGPIQTWGSNELQAGVIGSSQIGSSVIQTASGQISSANITGTAAGQLGHANGVVLVAAAPSGAINELISAVVSNDFATAAYTGGGNLSVNISGGGAALTGVATTGQFIQSASDKIIELVPLAATFNTYTAANGLALVSSVAPTNPGTAAGVFNWFVAYRQIPALLD